MPSTDAWDDYWRRAPAVAAYRGDGREDANLAAFWLRVFERARQRRGQSRILDFACGSGAVTGFAQQLRAASPVWKPEFFAFDRAPAAAAAYQARFPGAPVLVADAGRTPYADGSFELVASLFGIEYAGMAAIDEAVRLVAPRGELVAVVHRKYGPMYRECEADLHAVEAVRQSALLEAFGRAVQPGAVRIRAGGERSASGEVDAELETARARVQEVLRRSGSGVAGGALQRLLEDIDQISRQRSAYDPEAVREWTRRMSTEIAAYAARMSAMLVAAVDAASMEAMAARAQAHGLVARERAALALGRVRSEPAAWVLVCSRDP